MSNPKLWGFDSLEEFRKHTEFLAETGDARLLKDMADEMAAKYLALWELDEKRAATEAAERAALDAWMDEQEALWAERTRGV
jgi:hypothetical protein